MLLVVVVLFVVATVAGLWSRAQWQDRRSRRQRRERRQRHLARQSAWDLVFPRKRLRRVEHLSRDPTDTKI